MNEIREDFFREKSRRKDPVIWWSLRPDFVDDSELNWKPLYLWAKKIQKKCLEGKKEFFLFPIWRQVNLMVKKGFWETDQLLTCEKSDPWERIKRKSLFNFP